MSALLVFAAGLGVGFCVYGVLDMWRERVRMERARKEVDVAMAQVDAEVEAYRARRWHSRPRA